MATKFKRKQKIMWAGGICFAVLLVSVVLVCVLLRDTTLPAGGKQKEKPSAGKSEEAETPTASAPAENPLKPEDFVYENGYLTCRNMPTRLGIDVSYNQGEIDWQQVASAGIEFAIIRAGYRGTTVGGLGQDSYADANYEGAKDAGLQVGCYFFSQATTPEEAIAEAELLLEIIEGWELELPVVYDWEYAGPDSRTANMDARTLTDCTIAFCRTIKDAGYEPMIYFNENQSHKQMYLEELTDYGFWLAQYGQMLDYPYRVDMWQYTESGAVPGIAGNVDINLLFEYE